MDQGTARFVAGVDAHMTSCDPVLDVCDACGGQKFIEIGNDLEVFREEPCGQCDGTGFMLIDAEPIEMEDIA